MPTSEDKNEKILGLLSSEPQPYLSPNKRVYLDHNATTPPDSSVRENILAWLEQWGNPSSIHWQGRGPKSLMRDSRKKIAQGINCNPLELVFTSGGSEANNLALKGVYLHHQEQSPCLRNHYLFSAVEHPSVKKTLEQLAQRGAQVESIPVNRQGQIDLDFYAKKLTEKTALVSIMYANNETGHIFPIAKMAKMAHKVGALFHCDGVQALGKALVDVRNWQVDLASFSGHKFYALKGCGMLYVRQGLNIPSLISGGGQERYRRAGTENVLAIASLGEVFNKLKDLPGAIARMEELRRHLESQMLQSIPDIEITGKAANSKLGDENILPRLPNTTSAIIRGVDGETLLMNLDISGFSVSTGAACSSGNPEPSPVLLAMGLTRQEAQNSLRVSLGWSTTREQIDHFVEVLTNVVQRLRACSNMLRQNESE
ncbi:MAG: cysteine desulfurase [Bdellovibrionales bacterium]|nr:cysteine desulfurase [Bdellovibrionales bacterium]